MKKSLIYVSLILAALSLDSCSDFLDKNPSTSLTTGEAIECYDDAYAALIGVYDAVQGNSSELGWYGARAVYYGDVRGDLMQNETDGSRTPHLYDMDYTADLNAPDMWTKPYDAIRCANNLIKAIDEGKVADRDDDDPDVLDMKAQALVVRALAHFDLCKVYAPLYTEKPTAYGVPIIDFVPDPTYKPSRNTVAEVFEFVTGDLEEAAKYLYEDKNTGFINYWVAKALLSRVYLFMGEYQKAFQAAQDVIEDADCPYSLWTNDEYADYNVSWGVQGSSEFIWEIVTDGSSDWVDREGVPYLVWESGYADYIISSKGVKMFQDRPNDVRGQVTLAPMRADRPYLQRYGTDKVFIGKYPGAGFTSDTRSNSIYAVRYSEVVLNAAEAAFHIPAQASYLAEYYNAIASRDEDAVAKTAGEITIDDILDQRGLELIGEGFRYFDLARNGKAIDRTDRYTHVFPDPQAEVYTTSWYKSILPILLAERNANPNIEQNEGY